jgi:hypothetical protein
VLYTSWRAAHRPQRREDREGLHRRRSALVPEGREYPPHSLIVGIPARAAKDVDEEQTDESVKFATSTNLVNVLPVSAGRSPRSLKHQLNRVLDHDRKVPEILSMKVDELDSVNYD